jgi:hypothetical protein
VQLLLFFFLEGRYGSRAGGGTAGPEATNGAGGQGKRWEVGQCQLLCVVKKIESDGRNKGAEGGGGEEKGNRTILVFGVNSSVAMSPMNLCATCHISRGRIRSSVTWPNR